MDDVKMLESKISKAGKKSRKEAEKLIKDPDELEKFLQKLEKKLQTIPIAGTALAYVPVMISFVRMYIKKEYKEVPVATIIAIVTALIYFFSPIDFIPDSIPGVGYIDDAFIVTACLAMVRTDIDDYLDWRKKNGFEVKDLPEYKTLKDDAKASKKIFEAFFNSKTGNKD